MKSELRLIGTSGWENEVVHREPYRWALLGASFASVAVAERLRDAFPRDGYTRFRRSEGEKRHDLQGRALLRSSRKQPMDGLDPVWNELADELLSSEYRRAMSSLFDMSLDGLLVEAVLWLHGEGSFIDPHPDNADKVLTHLFYFGDSDWSAEHGGCLRILRSPNMDDIARELPPHLNTSVVFARSERSWHAYRPIVEGRERLSIQVVFHKPGLQYDGDGYKG